MHFLFVCSIIGPTIGGIETLISRMSKWLLNNGHKVTLLANSVEPYRDLFHDKLITVELGDKLRQLSFCHKAKKTWPALNIEPPDVIKSFYLGDSWIASVLSSLLTPTPKVLFGSYFPYIYVRSRNPFRHFSHRLFLLNMRRYLADDSILCMDGEQISQFRLVFGNHRNPTFWPLPVDNPNKLEIARSPKWGRIISVGRLEPMKEYNIVMIDIVARLRQKGYPVNWIVYGEGRFAEAMKARITALGLNEAIELKGKLAYSYFADALQNAYIFVGGGTSIVEAALCGVPGVMPLAYDSCGVTYGPWYSFPFGNLGMRTNEIPKTTVEAEIERILKLSKNSYIEEIKKSKEYARKYSIDVSMNEFLSIAQNASIPKSSQPLFYYFYAHNALEFILKKLK